MKTRVEAVLTGTSDGLIENGVQSAIVKRAVHGACWLACDGLTGDQQADRTAHGGFERALSHYPAEHYAQWRAQYVDRAEAFEIGALGENIATYGLTEADVCVGDMFYLGTATLQVAQPRQPCWKPASRTGVPDLTRAMAEQGRAGWFYRVLTPGWIVPGDTLRRFECGNSALTLDRIWHLINAAGEPSDGIRAELSAMAEIVELAPEWRRRAARKASRASGG